MSGYIVRRLSQAVLTLFLLSILFFLLTRLNAQNPCAAGMMGCVEMLHLNDPVTTQYVDWLGGLLHGNFGYTVQGGMAIGPMLLIRFPSTVMLVGISLVLQQLIALPLGILAALRPYSLVDQTLTVLTYVALSTPSFLLGFLLLSVFAMHGPKLPIGHSDDLGLPFLGTGEWWVALLHDPGFVLGDLVRHLILPVITLTVGGIAIDSRFMRAAMLSVLHEDYIRTARSNGLSRARIIFKHAFRNALLPIITNLGLYLPALIGGAVVVETVFTFGGLGYAFETAITGSTAFPGGQIVGSGDRPTLLALVMLSALAVVLANLLADLAYAWLDPRIRLDREGE